MSRFRPLVVAAFAAWTLLSWVGRFRNIWADATSSGGEKLVNSVPVLVFTVVGAAVAVVVLRTHGADLGRAGRRVVQVAAAWSIGYWLVRWPLIVAHDHPVGFKVVHTVLAAVAWGLAAASWRAVRPDSTDHEPHRSGDGRSFVTAASARVRR